MGNGTPKIGYAKESLEDFLGFAKGCSFGDVSPGALAKEVRLFLIKGYSKSCLPLNAHAAG